MWDTTRRDLAQPRLAGEPEGHQSFNPTQSVGDLADKTGNKAQYAWQLDLQSQIVAGGGQAGRTFHKAHNKLTLIKLNLNRPPHPNPSPWSPQ